MVVAAFLALLLAAGVVLIWEARTGLFTGATAAREAARAALFFLATVAGAALLIRTGGSLLFALALVPVTALSLIRFTALARRRWRGPASLVVLALALVVGVGAGALAVPERIDPAYLSRHIFQTHAGAAAPSIDPGARHSVRT